MMIFNSWSISSRNSSLVQLFHLIDRQPHIGKGLFVIRLYPDVLRGRTPSLDRGIARCKAPRQRPAFPPPSNPGLWCASCNLRVVSSPVGHRTPSIDRSRPVLSHPRRPSPKKPSVRWGGLRGNFSSEEEGTIPQSRPSPRPAGNLCYFYIIRPCLLFKDFSREMMVQVCINKTYAYKLTYYLVNIIIKCITTDVLIFNLPA